MEKYDQYKYSEEEMLRRNPDKRYVDAYRRVKRIKGFYVHLFVYIIVNVALIVLNTSNSSETFWRWQTFSTAFFWGIGLVGHGLSVFSREFFFGKNWEEKKIRELMDNENKQKKWE